MNQCFFYKLFTYHLQIADHSHITRYLHIKNYLQIKINHLKIANYLHITHLFTYAFQMTNYFNWICFQIMQNESTINIFHPLKLKNLHMYLEILQQCPPQSRLLRTSASSLVSLSSSSCLTIAFLFSRLKSVKIPLLMHMQKSALVTALV